MGHQLLADRDLAKRVLGYEINPYVHFNFIILCLTVNHGSGKVVVNLDTYGFSPVPVHVQVITTLRETLIENVHIDLPS